MKIFVIAYYEFLMQIKKLRYWLFTVIAVLFVTIDTIPIDRNLKRMTHLLNHDYVAMKSMKLGLEIIFLIMMFLIASQILNDKKTVGEMIISTPLKWISYILGKFLGLFVTSLLMPFLLLVCTMLIQLFMSPSQFTMIPYLKSYLFMVLPAMLFLTSISMTLPVILRNIKLFYILFIFYYFYCVFMVVDAKKLPVYLFVGDLAKFVFVFPGFTLPLSNALANLFFLLGTSLTSLLGIIIFGNRRILLR